MNTAIMKHLNHYHYIYLFIGILFGSGFLFGIVMSTCKQPLILFNSSWIENLITLDNIQSYMYIMLGIYVLIILFSFHALGILWLSLFTFIIGVHYGAYFVSLINNFPTILFLISDLLFIFMQWLSVLILLKICTEVSINIFCTIFVVKETLRLTEVIHQFLNDGFLSLLILFSSIILKTYLLL